MRLVLFAVLSLASFSLYAEGRCPPGQYPIGGQGAGGCAPIPTGGSGGAALSVPTGKWETRWGAVVVDANTNSTGVSVSQKSKREAVAMAKERCEGLGGTSCKLRLAYHNQCVAIADPTIEFIRSLPPGTPTTNMISAAATEDLAKSNAVRDCQGGKMRQECQVVYSACSMSEFREF